MKTNRGSLNISSTDNSLFHNVSAGKDLTENIEAKSLSLAINN